MVVVKILFIEIPQLKHTHAPRIHYKMRKMHHILDTRLLLT